MKRNPLTAPLSLYADDARILPPNGDLAQGRAGVEAVFLQMLRSSSDIAAG